MIAPKPKSRSVCAYPGCENAVTKRVVVKIVQAVKSGNGSLLTSRSRSYCETHAVQVFDKASEVVAP